MTDSSNPIIADLEWALYSANLPVPKKLQSLVWSGPSQSPLSTESQYALIANLETHRHRRLGRYFEALWQVGLTHHSDWNIELFGFPIREAQRTLGEIDLVISHLPTQQLTHLELALKFYLRVDHPNCGHHHHWLGPSLADSYEQKLKRLTQHQLPMGFHPHVTAVLKQRVDHQGLVIKGRLFVPEAAYSSVLKDQGYGVWLTSNALLAGPNTRECLPLDKAQWLTGPTQAKWQPAEFCAFTILHYPKMIWLRDHNLAQTHWAIVVPNDWAEKAICCCPQEQLDC